MRVLWLVVGLCCVALGTVGIVVPGLPTTIFFIAAAACFTRSSPRLERWVLDLPKIGPAISDYRAGRGMPRRAKVAAITSVVVFGGLALIVIDVLWVRGTVAAAALVGIAVILRVRTRVDGVPPDDTGT
jgi:uncharacterized membrane protein YbaN (DUF454 family)